MNLTIRLRTRLTLVSMAALILVLAAFGAGVYVLLNKTLHDNLDLALARRGAQVARQIETPFGQDLLAEGMIVQVVLSDGRVIGPPLTAGGLLLTVDDRVRSIAEGKDRDGKAYRDVTEQIGELRLYVFHVATATGVEGAVMVAAPRGNITETLHRLRVLLTRAGVIGLALAGFLLWTAARTALRPVEEVADAATQIGATGDLSRRVDPGGDDELGRLTKAFNGMLDRLETTHAELERTLEGQRRFLADASHELRTPLTTMRGNLEVIARSSRMSKEDLRAALEDSIEEAERMTRLVEDLLALARADAAEAPVIAEPVALAQVTRDAIELAATADQAEGGDGPRVNFRPAEDVIVDGSPDLLRRLVTNLVENAIKYTPAQGRIDVAVARENGWAVLTVADTGIGMSDEELEHAFDRFWRSDRSRGERGSGLGLAIARSVVEDHGGAIAATSEPGEGTTMTVRLPLRADPAPD
ncbi:MAG: sensor histidine kinase [Actinomycetota bacterium]